jgi:hypothetical protein
MVAVPLVSAVEKLSDSLEAPGVQDANQCRATRLHNYSSYPHAPRSEVHGSSKLLRALR